MHAHTKVRNSVIIFIITLQTSVTRGIGCILHQQSGSLDNVVVYMLMTIMRLLQIVRPRKPLQAVVCLAIQCYRPIPTQGSHTQADRKAATACGAGCTAVELGPL